MHTLSLGFVHTVQSSYFSSCRNRARDGQVVGQMGQVSTATRQGKERDGAQTKEGWDDLGRLLDDLLQ